MAFCQNCGKELADGARFCDGCGTAVGKSGKKGFFSSLMTEAFGDIGEVLKQQREEVEAHLAQLKDESGYGNMFKISMGMGPDGQKNENVNDAMFQMFMGTDSNKLKMNKFADAAGKSSDANSDNVKMNDSAVKNESKKKFCTKCGAELLEEKKFCIKCGTKI